MMKWSMRSLLALVSILVGGTAVMAIEEASYQVVKKEGKFELREYAAHILAETLVEGDLEEAGSKAFRRLFGYVSGDNRAKLKVPMTAPVSQQPEGEKIAMTAPVGQQRDQDRWLVSFMMPGSYRLETLPEPADPEVLLRQVPARRMAAVRYSGFWSEKNYLRNKMQLEAWLAEEGLAVVGEAIWARYNSPFSLWFLRRNEILIPVAPAAD